MNGYNKVILAGNLTRDPEVRYTQGGTAIAKFGMAINRKWKDQNGEAKEEVTFVDISAFGKQAEAIGQYLKKGRPLLMEGRLRTESWEDKNSGQKRSKLTVVLESFTFLDSGGSGSGSARADAPQTQQSTQTATATATDVEDDVPF